jgi:hypothetical protein
MLLLARSQEMKLTTQHDTLLLITSSATTPELLALAPHIPTTLPVLVMTAAFDALPISIDGETSCLSESGQGAPDRIKPCPLLAFRPSDGCTNVILPAPIPVSEVAAFGVAAPTTSTTVAMALGDALALAVVRELHPRPNEVFKRNHPGGTIGSAV